MWKWPTECAEPVTLADLFPTLTAALAPGAATKEVTLDGMDLAAVLKNPTATLARDALFFHYPHYYPTTTPASAARAGEWKLIEYFEDQRTELFNLRTDPGEQAELAAREPARVTDLRGRLEQWRHDVGARLPRPNPDFKGKKK